MTDPLAAAARMRLDSLLCAMESAERVIVALLAREREALRVGCRLAANAVHIRVNDAARLYLNTLTAAKAALSVLEPILPEASKILESRHAVFGAILRIELATLATTRMAADCAGPGSADTKRAETMMLAFQAV
ncbi:MAG: hypothetical protein E2O93_07555 [Alphaproteobacteria bacterium]|nr:MAG: hypothetical protein E2O93_07555 [Alphaproteobacteria bacterium]